MGERQGSKGRGGRHWAARVRHLEGSEGLGDLEEPEERKSVS